MMNLLLWAMLGSTVCWFASYIIGGQRERTLMANVVIGIIGAISGEFVMLMTNAISGAGLSTFNVYSFIAAIIGMFILLLILQYSCINNGINPRLRQYRLKYAYRKAHKNY
jgi:uncharacterized membrane protein YeaQ/YmgE (transglycosylase-associated protein family)